MTCEPITIDHSSNPPREPYSGTDDSSDQALRDSPGAYSAGIPPIPSELRKEASAAPSEDERYLRLLLGAIGVSASYLPNFGQGRSSGITLDQFRSIYGADPFYSWLGLDSPLMYAAHKTAGGMTSVYRQIGIGSQWIFSQMLQDRLGLSSEDATWTYQVPSSGGKSRSLSLDARIDLGDVRDERARERLKVWIRESGKKLLIDDQVTASLRGAVFEVRQGYKSKDSKRQNADISNATSAFANGYMPVLLLFSTQIDTGVASRYMQARWLLLEGKITGESTESTYAFCRNEIGYDLAGFYQRSSGRLRTEIEKVLIKLLDVREGEVEGPRTI